MVLLGLRAVEEEEEVARRVVVEVVVGVAEEARGKQKSSSSFKTPPISSSMPMPQAPRLLTSLSYQSYDYRVPATGAPGKAAAAPRIHPPIPDIRDSDRTSGPRYHRERRTQHRAS